MTPEESLRHTLMALWEVHRDAGWPKIRNGHEGELMTLDTVISGCMVFFLDSEERLDPQRVDILEGCLADLDSLIPDMPDEWSGYFERLRTLAGLLVKATKVE
jgi:hypothetical protein